MRPYKLHKIDLKSDYPCPCRRRGRLKPIILTEAMGCDRCQQIFVVKQNGHIIEQLSSIYQKKAWRWTGYRWKNAYHNWTQSSLSIILVLISILPVLALIILPVVLRWFSARSIIFWATVLSLSIALLAFMLWIVYNPRS